MRAQDLMVRTVACVHAEDSLARAAGVMRDQACGSVVVVRPGAQVDGMLTDRDICMAALRSNRPLSDLSVAQSMSGHVHTCGPDDDVDHVQDQMSLHQVRRIPVVDSNRRLLGIITLDDIAKAAQAQAHLIAPAVRNASVGKTLGDISRRHLIDPSSGGSNLVGNDE